MYPLIVRYKLLVLLLLAACSNPCFGQALPTAISVVSAANYQSYVAPQSLASIFGSNLAASTASGQLDASGQLPTELAGTTVQVCGVAAGLVFIAPTQINFVVPAGLQPGVCPVIVTTNGSTATGTANITVVAPALFTTDGSTTGQAAAFNAVTFKAGPFPVFTPHAGSTDQGTRVALFGTGFRNAVAVAPPGTNPVPVVYATITNTSGNSWPATVEYVGPAPGFPGEDQVNLALPSVIDGSGVVSVTVTIDSLQSNPVTLDIANLNPPVVDSLSPTSVSPGSVVTIAGEYFGTSAMIGQGRIAVSLREPSGLQVSVPPKYVDSAQLQFIVPNLPVDAATFYYGPVTVCVEVDSATSCAPSFPAFNLTPPVLTGMAPGQTFLSLTSNSIQNGLAGLNQIGSTQVAQSLSASLGNILTQYTSLLNAAASGNPQTLTFQRADGTTASVTVDAAFVSRLDVLAASLQPVLSGTATSSQSSSSGSTLNPNCLNSQEQTLQTMRQTYRSVRSAAEAIIRSAVLSSITGGLAGCIGATTDTCITNATPSVIASEAMADVLTGLLYYPILATMSIETQPVFLNSIQIIPASVTSSTTTTQGGSAVLLTPGQQTNLNVQGLFVSIAPAQAAQTIMSQLVSAAVRGTLPQAGGLAQCDLCSQILKTCPQCSGALTALENTLTGDIGGVILNNLNNLMPVFPSTQAQTSVPLTAGTLRISPSGSNEVAIAGACMATPASVTGVATTNGGFEPFEFIADPGSLLLANEISSNSAIGSVFSTLDVAVGPTAPPLSVVSDSSSYNTQQQAYLSGSGFPAYTPIAISISGPSSAEIVVAMAYSDGSGKFGAFVPLSGVAQTGPYLLNAFVQNSTIRASILVTIAVARLGVQVSPAGGTWTSSPQTITVSAPGASQIFYTVSQSAGSIPANPPAPSATSNNGVITGSSGTLTIAAPSGQFGAWIYTFVAQDANGLGSVSSPYLFTIDLRPPGSGPRITGITTSPATAQAGQAFKFVIAGANFDPATAQVIFMGPACPAGCTIANSNLLISATQIYGSITLPGGAFSVAVQNASGLSNAFPLSVAFTGPTVASITTAPASPLRNQAFDFTITGTNFDPNSATVTFAGQGCTALVSTTVPVANGALTSRGPNQLSGTATLSDGCFKVTVQNGSGGTQSNSVALNISGAQVTALMTTPNPPMPGQAFNFTITGTNFDPATAVVLFNGPGCTGTPNPCTIPTAALSGLSSSQLSGAMTLPAGSFTVQVQDGLGGMPSTGLPLIVGGPQIVSINPSSSAFGQPVAFTITGASFDPNSASVVLNGPGCTPCTIANSVLTAKTPTQLAGTTGTLAAGIFTITVQNGATGTVSNSLQLTITPPTPQVSGITTTPNPPLQGQTFAFTIAGTGFDPGSAIVVFTGPSCTTAMCSLSVNSGALTVTSTQITGNTALTGGNFTVTVQNGATGTLSSSLPLTVSNPSTAVTPTLTGLTTSPNPPVGGQAFTFTITGSGFASGAATVSLTGPGCTPCTIASSQLTINPTSLSGTATLMAGSFTLAVQNGAAGTPSSSLPLTVSGSTGIGTPLLTGITTSPTPPVAGQLFAFTITGTNFDPNNATILFNGAGCSSLTTCYITASALTSTSSTQLSGTAVLTTGTFLVTVLNGPVGNTSNQLPIAVSASTGGTGTPQITGVSPNPAPSGSAFTFTISGSGFDPGSAAVQFSGPGCTTAVCSIAHSALTASATSIIGQAPALTAGSYTVTVENLSTGISSNAAPFTVSGSSSGGGAVQLTGVSTSPSPALDQQSFTLTLTGSGFDPTSAVVLLSGTTACSPCQITNATLTSKSATQLSGPITLAAGTYTVTVQNTATGTTSNSVSLSVAPQLTAITAAAPVAGSAFTFTLAGSGFDPTSALVTFTGPGCTPCSIANSALSSKTATTLSGSATLATAGTFIVTVQNGSSGAASNSQSLTVSTPSGTAAQVSTITTSPSSPTTQQSFTFTLTGTGFTPATAIVVFSGPGCTPCTIANSSLTSKSATQLAGSTTLTSAGTYTVTVQNGSSGAPSNGVTLTVSSPAPATPQITSITPTSATAGQTYSFTITGTNFNPSNVSVNFTGGTVSNLSLSSMTATQITGTVTLSSAATYTVTVQNGLSGTASNGVSVTATSSTGGGGGGGAAPMVASVGAKNNSPIGPATHGQQFTFIVDGSGFNPSTAIVNFTGPGCTPCTVANLFAAYSNQLAGEETLPSAGTYTVTVQNGSSGTPSNGVALSIQ